MRLILTVIGIIALSIVSFAKSNVCKSYSGKEFFLEKISYQKYRESRKRVKIDNLKIYFSKNRNEHNPITLEYVVNKHKRYYKYIFCGKSNKKEWCSIECDGGGFYVNKNLDILIENSLSVAGEPDSQLPTLAITQKDNTKYIKGKTFNCPKGLRQAKKLDSTKDNQLGKYVCYEHKSDTKYYGCIKSSKECKDLDLQHFGKYKTKGDVKKAFKRCKSSKPNQEYINNSDGNYVCYDYIDHKGEYKGCFSTIKSCKVLNKKHFGHYATKKDTQKALIRCKISLPQEE